ncbi:MAG: hypothetical protein ACFN4F_01275 [Porphyromonas endodontalis]
MPQSELAFTHPVKVLLRLFVCFTFTHCLRYNSCYAYTALPLTIELRSALGWRATTSVTLALAEEPGV